MSIQINIDVEQGWDEVHECFFGPIHKSIVMEHSLVSVHKWEAKYKKPFLTSEKNREETLFYLQCMTITQNVDPMIFELISGNDIHRINDYINDPMSATTVKDSNKGKRNHDIQTAETIYASMFELGIPFECRKWHLNQLIKLIEVCAARANGSQSMSRKDIMAQNRALNSARKAKHHTRG